MRDRKTPTREGERGAIALVAAVMLLSIFGMAALALDLGALFTVKRSLQAATDTAALAATYGLSTTPAASTTTFAQNYLGYNGFPTGRLSALAVTTGRYCPTATPTPASRFAAGTATNSVCPGDTTGTTYGAGPNAVQVTASVQSPTFFDQVLPGGVSSEPITATATATRIDEAGFEAGTVLAGVGVGVVNSVLTGILGSQVSLTTAGYQGLASTDIKALDFLNALSTQLGLTAGTYGSLLQSTVSIKNVLTAAETALSVEGVIATGTADPFAGLNSLIASITGSPSIQLGQLLNLGIWQGESGSTVNPLSALSAGINLYDVASLAAEIANGQNAIAIPSSTIGIPGVATVTVANSVIEPPQSPPFVFGPVGVTVHTAQVRLQLTLQLLNALSVLGGTAPLTLPIYVELGSGTATLTAISCGLNPATDATVTINAISAAGDAYVGTVSPSTPMTNFSQAVTVVPAVLSVINVTILTIPVVVVTITGTATVAVGSSAATPLTFNQTQIAALTPQTVTSTGMVANLLSTLGSNLHLTLSATVLGANFSLPTVDGNLITAVVTTLLAPVFAGLDSEVDGLLAALGVKLGYMDVTATGVRCGVPALVL
jgi:uncharacterized membrane protein